MAEYIEVGQLWKCGTCYHNGQYGCTLGLGCDHGESYRPAYDKLKKADVVAVVRCKDCKHWYDEEEVCLKIYSDGSVSPYAWQTREPNDFCSYGERKEE
jgi:hypothetical protein